MKSFKRGLPLCSPFNIWCKDRNVRMLVMKRKFSADTINVMRFFLRTMHKRAKERGRVHINIRENNFENQR